MPGYAGIFGDRFWESNLALPVAMKFTSSEALNVESIESLSTWLRSQKIRFMKTSVVKILGWASSATPGSTDAPMRQVPLNTLHDDLILKTEQINALETEISGIFAKTPYVVMMAIPGINVVTAADLAAELGPIENYANPNAITGRAGLFPARHQSARWLQVLATRIFAQKLKLPDFSSHKTLPSVNGRQEGVFMIDQQTEQAMRHWTLAQPSISAFIASQVTDVRQRDDLLQDVSVAILENFEDFDDSRSFKSWAIGIARNKIRNYFRSHKNKPLLFDSETVENLAAAFEAVSSKSTEPLDHLNECVGELDNKAKMLCDLRYEKDLKPAAIARQLGMTANSVSKGLQRIRASLKRCIEQKTLAGGAQ